MNAIERAPVETRVLNPTASEASYRKTNLKKKVLVPDSPSAEMSSAETAALTIRRHSLFNMNATLTTYHITEALYIYKPRM